LSDVPYATFPLIIIYMQGWNDYEVALNGKATETSITHTPPHFHRLGTKSARRIKCQGRSTAEKHNKPASLV